MGKLCVGYFVLGVLTTLSVMAMLAWMFWPGICVLNGQEMRAIEFSRQQEGRMIIVIGHRKIDGVNKHGNIVTGKVAMPVDEKWDECVLSTHFNMRSAVRQRNNVLEAIRADRNAEAVED